MIIFSVYSVKYAEPENYILHTRIKKRLESMGITYNELNGKYKGTYELALSVVDEHKEEVLLIATQYGQESILLIDANGQGFLHYIANGVVEPIGQWTEINGVSAPYRDSYTYDMTADKYYICKEK